MFIYVYMCVIYIIHMHIYKKVINLRRVKGIEELKKGDME